MRGRLVRVAEGGLELALRRWKQEAAPVIAEFRMRHVAYRTAAELRRLKSLRARRRAGRDRARRH